MKLILATPGLDPHQRRTVEYHLNRMLPALKRRLGRHHTGTLILRARLTSDGTDQRPLHHLTLSLRLPEHQVVVQKDNTELPALCEDAEKALKKELRRSIAKVRRENLSRKRIREKEAFHSFSNEMNSNLRQTFDGSRMTPETSPVFARLRPLMGTLYNYARDQIKAAEIAGEVPSGYLQPDDLVDQAIIAVLEEGPKVAEDAGELEARLFRAMMTVLEDEAARSRPGGVENVSLDSAPPEDERWGYSGTEMEEHEFYQPFTSMTMEDVLIDEHAESPEVAMSDMEQHRLILKLLSGFHPKARSAFYLNRVEGFELFEIAMIQNRTEDEVQKDIDDCLKSLRESLENMKAERQTMEEISVREA